MTTLAPKAEINPRSCYVGEVPIAHDRPAAKVGYKRASAYGEMPSPIAAGATKTHCLARGLRRLREPLSKAARRSWARGRFRARPHTLRVSPRREFWRRPSRNRNGARDARLRSHPLRLAGG